MSASMTHPGLPDAMTPFALLELIEKLSADLGLLDQDITYLRWVFRHTKRIDFNAGQICAVWMSVSKIAAELSFSPRKVHRIEERLSCYVVVRGIEPKGHSTQITSLGQSQNVTARLGVRYVQIKGQSTGVGTQA